MNVFKCYELAIDVLHTRALLARFALHILIFFSHSPEKKKYCGYFLQTHNEYVQYMSSVMGKEPL